MSMDLKAIGLVAGRGRYPLLFAEECRKRQVSLHVVAYEGETESQINELADEVTWLYVGQLDKSIKAFSNNGIDKVIFAGQIKPGKLFKGLRPDVRMVKLMASTRKKNADSLFSAIASEFEKDGVHVLPATTFLEEHLAEEGTIGKLKIKKDLQSDIDYGAKIAKEVSHLDIGQTVVLKNGTILAVEGFEGTDKAILRGGEQALAARQPHPDGDDPVDSVPHDLKKQKRGLWLLKAGKLCL